MPRFTHDELIKDLIHPLFSESALSLGWAECVCVCETLKEAHEQMGERRNEQKTAFREFISVLSDVGEQRRFVSWNSASEELRGTEMKREQSLPNWGR